MVITNHGSTLPFPPSLPDYFHSLPLSLSPSPLSFLHPSTYIPLSLLPPHTFMALSPPSLLPQPPSLTTYPLGRGLGGRGEGCSQRERERERERERNKRRRLEYEEIRSPVAASLGEKWRKCTKCFAAIVCVKHLS